MAHHSDENTSRCALLIPLSGDKMFPPQLNYKLLVVRELFECTHTSPMTFACERFLARLQLHTLSKVPGRMRYRAHSRSGWNLQE